MGTWATRLAECRQRGKLRWRLRLAAERLGTSPTPLHAVGMARVGHFYDDGFNHWHVECCGHTIV